MTPLRIAVVGAGIIGRKHVGWVRSDPEATIVAIADPSAEAARFATAEGFRCFTDHVEMLDTVRPDGVIVATPNAQHVSVGLACIERGIAALVEKPIADTLADAKMLMDGAMRAGVPLLIGHHRRHNPIVAKARALVADGVLGRLAAISCRMMVKKPASYFDAPWRREPGGGPILINLIHDVDLLRHIGGEIDEVQAIASSAIRGYAIEDTAAVLLRFANGAIGTVTVSDAVASPWSWDLTADEDPFFARNGEDAYVLSGTEGSLALPSLTLWCYADRSHAWGEPLVRERVAVDRASPFTQQLRHFCRVIRREEAPLVSAADAARTLAVVVAVNEAARSGRAVRVP
jgi:predicted dehydrogenase